ncbi:HEAT repeat domain-containing protein [bacterium]|nr:HEAT repeat domain-containing protein [bacterium]
MRIGAARLAAGLPFLLLACTLAAGCRRPVPPEKRLAREIASGDVATSSAAVGRWQALDPESRLAVVRVLASETTKYPFGLADAPGALRRLLPEVVPMLVELRAEPSMTSSADMALQVLGPDAAAAVPALEAATRGEDAKLRARAAAALVTIAPERAASLVEEHADADPQVSIATGLQLRYVPRAASAVPALADLLGSPRPRVREFAAGALAEIGPRGTDRTIERLVEIEGSDPDPRVRRAASRALRAIAPGRARGAG